MWFCSSNPSRVILILGLLYSKFVISVTGVGKFIFEKFIVILLNINTFFSILCILVIIILLY